MNPIIKEMIKELALPGCLALLSAVGSAVALWISRSVIRLIEQRFKVELNDDMERTITDAVYRAVKAVEEMGRKSVKAHLPDQPGTAKLDLALDRVRRELSERGISLSEEAANDRIHDALDTIRNERGGTALGE